jgi:prevent-host-death family protein
VYGVVAPCLAREHSAVYRTYVAGTNVSVVALRSRLAAVLKDVERGKEVLVTRSGRPVARLVPVADPESHLLLVGVHPPRRSAPVPRVKPIRLSPGASLTKSVLEARD